MVYNGKIVELKDIVLTQEDEFNLMILGSQDYEKYCIVLEVIKKYKVGKTIAANINMLTNN